MDRSGADAVDGPAKALAFVPFRWFLTSRTLWALASQMIAVAVGFQVYEISGDPFDLGLIGLAQFVPSIVLTIPAGHLADILDRRRLLMVCYLALTLCSGTLAWIAVNRPDSTALIIGVIALCGAVRALTLPAGVAIVPNLVPTTALPNAIALNSTSFQVATIAGPAIGGFLLILSDQIVYLGSGVLLIFATLMLTRIKGSGLASRPERGLSLEALFTGFRFVWFERIVLGSISLNTAAVLVGSVVALLPIYASDILGVGPGGLGLMRAAPAVGALVCAVVLGFRPIRRKVGPWLFLCFGVYGLLTVGFALSRNFLLSLLLLLLLGTSDMIGVYIRHLLVQLKSPDAIRGRVSAVNSVFGSASNELGDFESGVTASWWGPTTAAAVGGILTIAITIVWALIFPSLRQLEELPKAAS